MNEQADDGIRGLADFLTEEPQGAPNEEQEESEEVEAQSNEDQEQEGTDAEESEDSEEEAEDEKAEEQQPRKYKITVKGNDGADVEQEVEEAELISGYQRQADYTRKTQELAKKESEIAQVLKAKHDEFRNTYVQQAEVARAAMLQLAGLKTPQEMYELAQNDPAAAVAERERQQIISQMIGQVDQQLAKARNQHSEEMEAAKQNAQKAAWEKLSSEGITKDGLSKVYKDSIEKYGVNAQALDFLYDPGIVLMMRDALAFRELKAKAPEVTKKAKDAPRMPTSKQSVPNSERKSQELNKRFQSGKAKLSDLAAFLNQ